MNKILLLLTSLSVLLITTLSYAGDLSAVGYWNTVDDKTGKILSVVQIYQEENGSIAGKIYHIYSIEGQKPTDVCKECDGVLKDKPILGMKIIYDMGQDSPTEWVGGRVLDPKSGKVYRGKMTLIANGCKLNLRGYVGIPLFGRTETWLRTKSKVCKAS
jgi:uncharacterized protein (DUF2147 family)